MNASTSSDTIGQTIIAQIKAQDFWALGAWGCTFTRDHRPMLTETGVHIPAGRAGKIVIDLDMATDTYKVRIGKLNKRTCEWKCSFEAEGVQVEELVRVIDSGLGR